MTRGKRLINPDEYLRQRQLLMSKLKPHEIQRQVFPLLAHYWVIANGKPSAQSESVITQHIVMLQIFAAETDNKPLYQLTEKAVVLWLSALDLSQKRGEPPDLSTSAKKALSQCVAEWDKALHKMHLGLLMYTCSRWDDIRNKFVGVAA